MKDLFKEIIPSLLQGKEHQLDDNDENSYNPFIINKSLSNHIDCIFHAANMNLYNTLDSRMQYDYYFHILKKYKRPYQKWNKYKECDDILNIKTYYNCSSKKAREILTLLTKDQLSYISEKLDIGGKASNNK